jgi:hypothetical protein
MPFYPLNCLSFDESWSLFCKAVLTAEQESDDIPTNLIKIGKSIVTKCKGLPLAIKTLGSMLRYENDQRRWMNVLESELWDLKEPRDEILAALELSYKHMPVQLRRCFLCLSLFPKDYKIYASEVSRLWKLLDLLDSDGSDNECEIAKFYLKELAQRSILQLDSCDDSYLLHELIHDLACFFAGEEFHRIEGDTSTEIPQNVRYLSINKAIASADISVFPHSVRVIRVPHCPPTGTTFEKYPRWLENDSLSMLTRITLSRGEHKQLPKLGGAYVPSRTSLSTICVIWNVSP